MPRKKWREAMYDMSQDVNIWCIQAIPSCYPSILTFIPSPDFTHSRRNTGVASLKNESVGPGGIGYGD